MSVIHFILSHFILFIYLFYFISNVQQQEQALQVVQVPNNRAR